MTHMGYQHFPQQSWPEADFQWEEPQYQLPPPAEMGNEDPADELQWSVAALITEQTGIEFNGWVECGETTTQAGARPCYYCGKDGHSYLQCVDLLARLKERGFPFQSLMRPRPTGQGGYRNNTGGYRGGYRGNQPGYQGGYQNNQQESQGGCRNNQPGYQGGPRNNQGGNQGGYRGPRPANPPQKPTGN